MTWDGLVVCVAGVGVSGAPVARELRRRGARVTVVDAADGDEQRRRGADIEALGAQVRLGEGESLPAGTELVVTSPGWRPTAPLLVAASDAGVPVIGEVELAWRLRPAGAAPWLALTGTNGKTTTVKMLAAMLRAAGHDAVAAGNVGTPVIEAVLEGHDVLAVELSSFQLHWSTSVRPFAAAVINVAVDHLDWHRSFEAYAEAKGRIYTKDTIAIDNADDDWSVRLAERGPSKRRVSFTLQPPQDGQLGVSRGAIIDRAFGGGELFDERDVHPFAPHNVANALAAAALGRAYGVDRRAVRDGLQVFEPDPHRISEVAIVEGVRYVDDSKATNPHAAAASLAAYPTVVWVAGGQLKGASVDDLITRVRSRLRGVVLLGQDRALIRAALARHAPEVPAIDIESTDTGAMTTVVHEAARLARPGDTVLLAPAGASFDMFSSYKARGDAFTEAARRLAEALQH
jgi:UDP-N-acetylmuramoylalanine--D-glutamate ligase